MTFSIMELNIKGVYVTLSISDTVRNNALHYAECCILLIVMLSVIMLSVVVLSVVAPLSIFSLAFMMF